MARLTAPAAALLLAVGLLAACASTPETPTPPAAESPTPAQSDESGDLIGAWRVVGVAHRVVPENVDITMVFAGNDVSGTSGCNTYGGTFETDGDHVTFGPLRTTMMACDGPGGDFEASFLAVLENVRTYARQSSMLYLRSAKGNGTYVEATEA